MAHTVCNDTCQTTSGQDVSVNVEELEAGVGEGPEPIFPEIKAESEVSCVSVFSSLHISQLLYAHMSAAHLTSLYTWQ